MKSVILFVLVLFVLSPVAYTNIFGDTQQCWFHFNNWYLYPPWLGPENSPDSIAMDFRKYGKKDLRALPSNTDGNTMSFQAWVKIDKDKADNFYIKKYPLWCASYDPTNMGTWLLDSASKIQMGTLLKSPTRKVRTSASFPSLIDNYWHYIAVDMLRGDSIITVYDEYTTSIKFCDTMKFYVDGKFISQDTVWWGAGGFYTTAAFAITYGTSDSVTVYTDNYNNRWADSEFPGWIGVIEMSNIPRGEAYIINHWNTHKPDMSTIQKKQQTASYNNMSVFPNPTKGTCTFRLNGVSKKSFLSIYTVKGVLIDNIFSGNTDALVLWDKKVPTGIYICKFTTENRQELTRLIITK